MGMYTELNLGVRFRKDTPQNIIDILKYMLSEFPMEYNKPQLPDHPLFKTDRWTFMLNSESYYFDGHTDSSIQYDDICDSYFLNVRCNLKNYKREIEHFLNFIQPYLYTDGFLGYMRYEEEDDPTLIYNEKSRIKLFKADIDYYGIKGVTV